MKLSLKKIEIYKYAHLILALIFAFWMISAYEIYASKAIGEVTPGLGTVILYKFINDFWSGLIIGGVLFPVFLLINLLSNKGALTVLKVIFTLLVIIQFSLIKYSLTTLLNLGADILGYSYDDIFSTVSVSESINITYILPFIIFPLLLFLFYVLIKKYVNHRVLTAGGICFILVFGSVKIILPDSSANEYQNKTAYLTMDIVRYQKEKSKMNAYNVFERNDYPLLKSSKQTEDVLTPFFESNEEKPNIVVIVVEGLGSEFVGDKSYSGFTPYFDTLISKSLYWENFVSTTGRSFGALPSIFASLPYGENGFLELTDTPSHLSLISILKANGYATSYFSGGPSSFDRKVNFLEYNGIDKLIDENKYGSEYIKTKSNEGGFSWGYPDDQILKKTLASLDDETKPRLDIVLTLTNHEPFQFPEKEKYISNVESLVESSGKSSSWKEQILNHKDIFGSLLYTDEAIKEFMDAYAQREDYENTIFIITGDHRLIPITQKDKLCRFHVPFLIYSPMLKQPEKFKSVSSHWDVTPSVLSYLTNNYKFKPLEKTAWMSKGLDTVRAFRNTKNIPLMRYKGSLNDMIYKDYLYAGGELFKINENFGTYKITDELLLKTIEDSLMAFKKMNAYVTQRNKIFPDSLNVYVAPKIKFSEDQLTIIKKFSEGKNFDELLYIARDLSFKKEYKTTRLLCDYILNEFPNYTDARILKGRTFAWEGEYAKSEIELLSSIQRSPFYDDPYLAILDMYWWSGQEEKSKLIFKQAVSNELLNPELSFKMAKAYKRMEHLDLAKKVMDSIIQIHPENADYITFKKTLE